MIVYAIGVDDPEFAKRAFAQVLELFVTPEVKIRQNEGKLARPINLWGFQVLFSRDGSKTVRINKELNLKILASFEEGGDRHVGDQVDFKDIKDIQRVEIPQIDRNCAHYTAIKVDQRWFAFSDFRYNRNDMDIMINVASEFLKIARDAYNDGLLRGFVANLFYSVEILAKAELFSSPHVKDGKTHGYWKREFNKWQEMGNVEPKYSALLNDLSGYRQKAIYSLEPIDLERSKAEELIEAATSLLARVKRIAE